MAGRHFFTVQNWETTAAASMAVGSMATASIIMLDMAAENMAAADIVNKARLCYCSIVMIKLNRAGGLAFCPTADCCGVSS